MLENYKTVKRNKGSFKQIKDFCKIGLAGLRPDGADGKARQHGAYQRQEVTEKGEKKGRQNQPFVMKKIAPQTQKDFFSVFRLCLVGVADSAHSKSPPICVSLMSR